MIYSYFVDLSQIIAYLVNISIYCRQCNEKPEYNESIVKKEKYQVLWQSLKRMFSENSSESHMKFIMDNCKQYNIPIEERMFVVSLNWGQWQRPVVKST